MSTYIKQHLATFEAKFIETLSNMAVELNKDIIKKGRVS